MVADEVKQELSGQPVAAGHLLINKEQLIFSEPTFLQSFNFIKHLNLILSQNFTYAFHHLREIFNTKNDEGLFYNAIFLSVVFAR